MKYLRGIVHLIIIDKANCSSICCAQVMAFLGGGWRRVYRHNWRHKYRKKLLPRTAAFSLLVCTFRFSSNFYLLDEKFEPINLHLKLVWAKWVRTNTVLALTNVVANKLWIMFGSYKRIKVRIDNKWGQKKLIKFIRMKDQKEEAEIEYQIRLEWQNMVCSSWKKVCFFTKGSVR